MGDTKAAPESAHVVNSSARLFSSSVRLGPDADPDFAARKYLRFVEIVPPSAPMVGYFSQKIYNFFIILNTYLYL